MKKIRLLLISFVVVVAAFVGLIDTKEDAPTASVSAAEPALASTELVSDSMEWTYLDDQTTDPNKGTWYEEWNKKNGWVYSHQWLDWGEYPQEFSDATWKTHTGSPKFSTDASIADAATLDAKDGKAGPTYFFRYLFDLPNPEDVKTIKIVVRYNDAMILYLNGKSVDSFFNIPTSNYKNNLDYGCQEKVDGNSAKAVLGADGQYYFEETIYMEDVSSLVDEWNPELREFAIAAEIHCSDENDTDAYFELVSFELNPAESELAETEAVKSVAVNTGADENSVNFAWYAKSNAPGYVQIAEGSDTSGAFPLDQAVSIPSTQANEAYTKFYSSTYYSNKATYSGVEPGKNYVYRVGSDDGWSQTYELKTQDISDGYEVIFLSDAQIGTGTVLTDRLGWSTTLDKAFGAFPNTSFIANTGDFVDVATKENEYDAYFYPSQLNNYPTATAVGNHDVSANYGHHFNEPNASTLGASAANSNYYFTYGNVLYMVLNTSNTNNAEHRQFMEDTMAATAAQDYDWTVVMFHQSIYASGKQSIYEDAWTRQEQLVPAFDDLGIDIVLMGHDHCYARTYQMENFSPVEGVTYEDEAKTVAVDPEGTLYLTTSSASGSKYYDLVEEYAYLAHREQSYVPTFSHLTFTEDTFTMSAYRTDTMEEFDTYTIKKTKTDDDTKVITTPAASTAPKAGDTTSVNTLMWVLLASGFAVSALYLRKQSKKS